LINSYSEFIHYLPAGSSISLLTGLLFIVAALVYSVKCAPDKWTYALLFIGFFLFGSGFALIDSYLNEWDEQYHALVAKNLSENPLKPVLIQHSPLELDFTKWTYNHIWLHKQPLFLWQIALSIKLFGANLWAVRFPGILLHALTALMTLSIARRFMSDGFAMLTCILFGCSAYYNDYISGAIGMDHNDVAFVFYVTLSFWAWFNYRESRDQQTRWIVLIGISAGFAILCKWLVGFLVFSGWGIVLITTNWKDAKEWLNLLKSFVITLVVVAPWQIYCYLRFPREYVYELTYNSEHFMNALEKHTGDNWFYWELLDQSYGTGEAIRWIILAGILLFLFRSLKKSRQHLFAFSVFIITYIFFTIAATKLQGYVTIVASLGFIFLIYPFYEITEYIRRRKPFSVHRYLTIVLTLLVLFIHFNPKGVIDRHKFRTPEVRISRQVEIARCIRIIRANQSFHGYFLIKGNQNNILVPLLFHTNAKIHLFNDLFIENIHSDYYVIDLAKKD
jgi:4-amino-4-deoxy-L-arabinose transferase